LLKQLQKDQLWKKEAWEVLSYAAKAKDEEVAKASFTLEGVDEVNLGLVVLSREELDARRAKGGDEQRKKKKTKKRREEDEGEGGEEGDDENKDEDEDEEDSRENEREDDEGMSKGDGDKGEEGKGPNGETVLDYFLRLILLYFNHPKQKDTPCHF
jgi:hypothetical protein